MTAEILGGASRRPSRLPDEFKRIRFYASPGTYHGETNSIGLNENALPAAQPIADLLTRWGHVATLEATEGSTSDYEISVDPPISADKIGVLTDMAVSGALVSEWSSRYVNSRRNGVIVFDNRNHQPTHPTDSHSVLDSTLMRELAENDASAHLSA